MKIQKFAKHYETYLARVALHTPAPSMVPTGLIKKLVGTRSIAWIVEALLRLMAESKHPDAEVVISAKKLGDLALCSDGTVYRAADKLEAIGFIRILKKDAEGSPTIHYRLNLDKFIESIAAHFDFPPDQVKRWMKIAD